MIEWWLPQDLERRRPALETRTRVRAAVEGWLASEGFVSVETPILQVSPGMEPHIQAFRTEYKGPRPGEGRELWLHTSPEFAMKKLLAAGLPRIAQFARVFRNGEATPLHHPEFTMLEWYRAEASYRHLVEDCQALVRTAARAAGCDRFAFRGMEADPFADWRVLTVADAFAEYAGIDLLATCPDPAAPDVALLRAAAEHAGVRVAADDSWEDVFFRVMLDRIEPHLGQGVPCVLTDYPVSLAALARPKPEDPRLAERFELYICGVELANAFGELTDPAVQRARFEADMDLKQRLYGIRHPIDEGFLAALARMPDAAGIALGFDRLAMLCAGVEDIRDVLWAPVDLG
ncbi:MAG TPA: EF-P lysine aminoacylase EpmA [Azospirillaceae bacterium]|nr:EF-P lysine aminoacylase EpmA [Azospirillaceae bacterium]